MFNLFKKEKKSVNYSRENEVVQRTPKEKLQQIIDDFGGHPITSTSFRKNLDKRFIKHTSLYQWDTNPYNRNGYTVVENCPNYSLEINRLSKDMKIYENKLKGETHSAFADENGNQYTYRREEAWIELKDIKKAMVKDNKILIVYDKEFNRGNDIHCVYIFEVEHFIPDENETYKPHIATPVKPPLQLNLDYYINTYTKESWNTDDYSQLIKALTDGTISYLSNVISFNPNSTKIDDRSIHSVKSNFHKAKRNKYILELGLESGDVLIIHFADVLGIRLEKDRKIVIKVKNKNNVHYHILVLGRQKEDNNKGLLGNYSRLKEDYDRLR